MNGKTVMLLSQAYTLLDIAEENRKVALKILKEAVDQSGGDPDVIMLHDEWVRSDDVYRVLDAEGFHPATPRFLS